MVKDTLKSQSDTLGRTFFFSRDLIDSLEQLSSHYPTGEELRASPCGNIACSTRIGEVSSCSMLHLDFSTQHSRSPSLNHSCGGGIKGSRADDELRRSYLTKLCHSTPVGSSSTRTKTETSAHSSSIVGLLWPS